jgi:hypothetical protein
VTRALVAAPPLRFSGLSAGYKAPWIRITNSEGIPGACATRVSGVLAWAYMKQFQR